MIITASAELQEEERHLVLEAWSAADRAYVPYSSFPVGVAILAENESGQSQVFAGGNIQNKSWDVDCCAERAVAFSAFEQGFRRLKVISLLTLKKPGGMPCGLCRQVLVELAPEATLLCIQNKENDVKVWTVSDLLPEAQVREIVSFDNLAESERELALLAIEKAALAASPYSNIIEGAAVLARNRDGDKGIFHGVRIENAVYGGTVSAARVAAYRAVSEGYQGFLKVAVYADGSNPAKFSSDAYAMSSEDGFVNLSGACLQTLRQFGLNTKVLNISISKELVGCATIAQLLPDSFGPNAVF